MVVGVGGVGKKMGDEVESVEFGRLLRYEGNMLQW